MELSSLNSLAELGAALNLAIGLIKEIRDHKTKELEAGIAKSIDTFQLLADEAAKDLSGNVSANFKNDITSEMVKIGDIKTQLKVDVKTAREFGFNYAMCTVGAMFLFLTFSAAFADLNVPGLCAPIMLLLILLPSIMTVRKHTILYKKANDTITSKTKEKNKEITYLIRIHASEQLTPKNPDSK